MSPVILAQDIYFTREGRKILTSVSMELMPGSILTLIGPNGAGKSTLVKILLGIEQPDSGTIKRKDGLTVGYMPQRISIDESMPMSVSRFLAIPNRISRDEAINALSLTGVVHLIDHQIHRLSGGEFQRVLLARALVLKPELLVLDEPVQGVDFTGEIELYELIHKVRNQLGCAIIMVSHDLHIVMANTDEVICLNHHVCCSGTPETVKGHPEFLELFGTINPAISLYTHNHNHQHGLDDQGHTHG